MSNPLFNADVSRRGFLAASVVAPTFLMSAQSGRNSTGAAPAGTAPTAEAQGGRSADKAPAAPTGPFELAPLPWKEDALAPHISAGTIGFHYGRHHKGYVDTLNKLVDGKRYASMTLDQVVSASAKEEADVKVFNAAAQAWNHAFYWKGINPKGGGEPTGRLADKIKSDFQSFDEFKKQLTDAALTQFGSGWAWLVVQDDKLRVIKTGNADTPAARGIKPLLTIDVWEHAYYLDYQNRRNEYVKAFIEHLVNWEFVLANMA